MIQLKNGNLLNAPDRVICHQVNCQGLMGAGVALQIRTKWPNVYTSYVEFCKTIPIWDRLGRCQIVGIEGNRYVANLFGQNDVGTDRMKTEYPALKSALIELKGFCVLEADIASVAIPFKIGCGLGGGNWDKVMSIISDTFKNSSITANIYYL